MIVKEDTVQRYLASKKDPESKNKFLEYLPLSVTQKLEESKKSKREQKGDFINNIPQLNEHRLEKLIDFLEKNKDFDSQILEEDIKAV